MRQGVFTVKKTEKEISIAPSKNDVMNEIDWRSLYNIALLFDLRKHAFRSQ